MSQAPRSIDPLTMAGAKAKGKRPFFLDNPDNERVLNIVMTLAQEVAVMRERLDTVERLLEKNAVVTRADIEAFSPSKAEAQERGAMMQEFLARVLRIVQQEREALTADDQTSEDVADELAKT